MLSRLAVTTSRAPVVTLKWRKGYRGPDGSGGVLYAASLPFKRRRHEGGRSLRFGQFEIC
jgi:hypothetical protein